MLDFLTTILAYLENQILFFIKVIGNFLSEFKAVARFKTTWVLYWAKYESPAVWFGLEWDRKFCLYLFTPPPPPFREHLLSDGPLLDWKVSSVWSEMACSVLQEARFQWPEKDTKGALYGVGQEWVDLHESGTIGYALKRTSTDIGFCFLNSTLWKDWKDFKILSRFMQKCIQPPAYVCIASCLPIGWRTFVRCSILVWIAGCWNFLLTSHNPKNNWCLSRIFGAWFGKKDRGLSTCKPWSKQVGGWIHFCMKWLRTLNSYQIFKIQNKK